MSMTVSGPQGPLDAGAIEDEQEFSRIEAALAETERGRRFLAAHARRHRGADTQTLLQAIARLESVVRQEAGQEAKQQPARPRDDRADWTGLAEAVAAARVEIGEGAGTAEPFEVVARAAERTSASILAAAEAMQEAARTLREEGADAALCDTLDHQAAAIGTACAAQDRTTRASLRIAGTLDLLETRIAAMLAQRSGAEAGPQPAPRLATPSSIPAEDEIAFAPETPQVSAQADLATAFADLDRLSIEEKIALFS